jgi:Calcineurin-like phosphoesterase
LFFSIRNFYLAHTNFLPAHAALIIYLVALRAIPVHNARHFSRRLTMAQMKISIDPVVSSRIQAAWNKLSPQQRAMIQPAIDAAHKQALFVAQNQTAPPVQAASHGLMLAQSAITGDADNVVGRLDAGAVFGVAADGVMWGTGKYQQLDPGWVEAFAVFLETQAFSGKHPFIANPPTIAIPDTVCIALAGDWGTGDWGTAANPAPSTKIKAQLVALKPDISIHLGDVYYAGTSDEELHNLTNDWPAAPLGSYALNSNHEMYSGAKPYFDAITEVPFGKQNGCSYFALENTNWVIVALDSGYFASESSLYIDGSIAPAGGTTQLQFLQAQVAKGKKVIVLTHHNGLAVDGTSATALWSQVMQGFGAGQGPTLWYWGHEHAGAVYAPFGLAGAAQAKVAARCCGHGALPWGQASDLAKASAGANPTVLWYENRPAGDPDNADRVFNGFAVLCFKGATVQETFYDENGGTPWKS